MKKFEGILICTDLDGTLLATDKSISKENLEAIEYFKSEGGLFTFITGRMPFFCSGIYSTVKPNAPFGCINGGGIFDHRTEKYVWTRELDPSAADLAEYAEKKLPGIGIQINTFERIYFCRDSEAMTRFRQLTGVPRLVRDIHGVDEPIAKILFGDTDPERLARLAEILSTHPRAAEFDFIRSEHTLYEILPKGISKGTGLMRLAEHLNISMKKTVALGDYDNDASMLGAAGLGIAVKNASACAKASADRVTVSNDENAVAKVISELDSGLLKL